MDTSPDGDRNAVKSVQTAFRIVETINDAGGAGISDIAAETGIAKSTIFRHLKTLEGEGYLVREGDTYHLGLQFLDLGDHARSREKGHMMARQKVEELVEITDERVQYMVEEHGYVFYVHRAIGTHAVNLRRNLGDRIPVHTAAAGKAILANSPDEKIHEVCDQHGLEPITEHTITDREALFDEIERIRERGYSYNRQEHTKGVHAVGVAVNAPDGQVLGGLSIAGPAHRLKGELFERELPDLLLGTANELELNIRHS